MKTYTIELRTDFDSDDKESREKMMEEAMKMAAKHVLTTAILLSGKRRPQVALTAGDFFASEEEISLADDISTDDVETNYQRALEDGAGMEPITVPEEVLTGEEVDQLPQSTAEDESAEESPNFA